MINDDFEFPVPPELLPWIESQREKNGDGLNFYILVNGKITRASLTECSAWFQNITNRRIDYTVVGDVVVSTVFLGIDHGFSFDDLVNQCPVLFESMIFGGCLNELQWRYKTLGEAKQGHYELVAAVKESRKPCMQWRQNGFWNWFREMFE